VNGPHRHAATEEHQRAITTINDMFDRLDELVAARDRLTGVAPLGLHDDPIRDAESLLHHAELLNQALSDLRLAALAASAHRRRSDLAADVGTKVTSLFPRTAAIPARPAPWTTRAIRRRPQRRPTPTVTRSRRARNRRPGDQRDPATERAGRVGEAARRSARRHRVVSRAAGRRRARATV
jgi:hypothetical protein